MKVELLNDHTVNQEVDHNNKSAMQLFSKIRSDMRELQIAAQKDSNKKKSIMAPTVEEPQKNLFASANKGKPSKLPIGEIQVAGAPSGGGGSGGSSEEGRSDSPTKSRSTKRQERRKKISNCKKNKVTEMIRPTLTQILPV